VPGHISNDMRTAYLEESLNSRCNTVFIHWRVRQISQIESRFCCRLILRLVPLFAGGFRHSRRFVLVR
jgi:hypothetical protein